MGQHSSHPTLASFTDAPPPSTVPMTRPELHAAFEYISKHLIRHGIHLTLVVTGRALSVLRFRSTLSTTSVSLLQTTPITKRELRVLSHYVHKASLKFGFSESWIHNSLESTYTPEEVDILSTRSLIQNDVVFSAEGLTLLSVDLCFALKYHLGVLTQCCSVDEINCTVAVVRKLVNAYQGRPLTKGYIARCYSGIQVSDYALLRVNALYEYKYGARGIVGVNDAFLAWRREGRYDLERFEPPTPTEDCGFPADIKGLALASPTRSSASSSPCQSFEELEPTPFVVRYKSSSLSDECSTPTSVRSLDSARMQQFLKAYNIS